MIVVWRVTEKCNLTCPFCSYDRRVARTRREADVETIRNFGSLLAQHQRTTGDAILVSWIGGEPLLWAPLTGLSEWFHHMGLGLSVTTNGTGLESATAREHVLSCYRELTVSVDAIGDAHDRLRGWPGAFESIRNSARWLAGAKRSRGRGPLLRANVVLMRHTIEAFEELSIELAGWGIEEITFNALGGRDRPEFFPENRLLPEQTASFARQFPVLRERCAGLGVRLLGGDLYLNRILASSRDTRIPVEDCHPGERFLFINERGVVSPCHFTSEGYGVPLGDVKLGGLARSFSAARRDLAHPACGDCHCTQIFEKFRF
jgi:MoaA/NifB/PqqE/SkfB family radical SAM enzyme